VAWQLHWHHGVIKRTAASKDRSLSSIGWLDALVIGLAQAVTIVPGISRSGATIAAGLRGRAAGSGGSFQFFAQCARHLGAGCLNSLI
jgi:undecaprenyl-diphosphatase